MLIDAFEDNIKCKDTADAKEFENMKLRTGNAFNILMDKSRSNGGGQRSTPGRKIKKRLGSTSTPSKEESIEKWLLKRAK